MIQGDIVRAILECLENKHAIGNVFNTGNPRSTVTTTTLAEKIKHLTQSKSEIMFVPSDAADVHLRVPSIDKARKILGYEPQTDLNQGLTKTIEWYEQKLANFYNYNIYCNFIHQIQLLKLN